MLVISNKAKISKLADIEDSIRGSKIIIGDDTVIDSFVRIKPVGGIADIEIGNNVHINSGCVLFSGNGIKIGNDVLLAPGCILVPVNHAYKERSRTIIEQRFNVSRGGITIGNDVWIGAGSTILDGVMIPDGVVIGACSLVMWENELKPYGIYAGNPLQFIGNRE